MNPSFPIRPEAAQTKVSGIVEVVDYGRLKPGLIPLWVGEGDLSTPAFIAEAATRSLAAGETFYTWQRGIPELRAAIAAYMGRVYGRSFSPDRFTVTIGGMHAMQIAARLASGEGDEVIVPTPAWPNFAGALGVAGARVVEVPMTLSELGWRFDANEIARAVTKRTRAIVINSPSNPTGWTATGEELRAVLELARDKGLWIIADEIYGRYVYDDAIAIDGRAPSFHDYAQDDDLILYCQTMSKNWAMTGWRIGWIEAPAALGQTIENLVQYSSSGVPVFVQRAAITALEHGESFVAHQIARARRGREIVYDALAGIPGLVAPKPPGALYAFFALPGRDARATAFRLIDEAGVGLAPGGAFGDNARDCLRLCFARKAEDLEETMRRLEPVLTEIAGAAA
ncbi:MAG: aminotransferase class I/II-fold pyridoxal phosphate-dependent enzyme [Salinarimonadaceae bacterium]|nr:MAG: aminotransferase class I/II-fold pyridoxal phosphate-dependent enzyme [Salinarimonadaceae bacterium]